MPTRVQFRRGNTSQNNSFTGAVGEVSVNTDNSALRVHNGSTAGGVELARADLSNTTGISTLGVNSLNIGATEVISSARQLKNIASLDATTTATIESAVAAAPNDFTSLNISGIGTVVTEFDVGVGATVFTAVSATGRVGINSVSPAATLDIGGNQAVSGSITVGSATTISANSLRVGQTVEVTNTAVKFAGVEVVNSSGIYLPVGVVTAATFSGPLVGNSTGTHTGSVNGNLTGTAATVTGALSVTGISSFSSSVAITGVTTHYNNVKLLDNNKLLVGDGDDLQIYHDGSDSYVDDAGGGSLYVRGNAGVYVQKYTGESMIDAVADGGVTLYHDNVGIVTTRARSVQVNGGVNASGVTTSMGGFISGIGQTTAVQITFSGNQLTFTVPGIGVTTLTLF